jgi:thiosulfate dehydrogenase
MRRTSIAALLALLIAVPAKAGDRAPPDPDALPDDVFGRTVRLGRDLIVHTAASIGPDAPDPAERFAGNGLECQSCHLDAGTQPFSLPLAGAWGLFPQFIGREGAVRTLEDRINACMERSMNGRALPAGSPQMKAMLSYIRFISEGVPTGAPAAGRGVPALPLPEAASDPSHGAEIYGTICAACHQPDGQGQRLASDEAAAQLHRYLVPPLWGRTATMTARAWRARSRPPASSAPTCRAASSAIIPCSACRTPSTSPCSSTASRGRIARATSWTIPTAR